MTIRAVRNNNPGNIRVGIKWHGLMPPEHMTPEQAAETQFCVFATPADGFRAMAAVLLNYKKLHAITNLRAVIARWAPPSENNTGAYLTDVCSRMHMGPDDPFPFGTPSSVMALCKAIATHEAGGWFFNDFDLQAGVSAAL